MDRRLAAVLLACVGCRLDTEIAANYRCPAGQRCPDGMMCIDGYCREGGGADGDGGAPDGDAMPGPDGGTPSCGVPTTLIADDFDSTALAPYWWSGTDGYTTPGDHLELELYADSPDTYSVVRSFYRYDLRGGRLFVEVPQVPEATLNAVVDFAADWGCCTDDAIGISESRGELSFWRSTSGVRTEVGTTAYQPSVHRFWQMREAGAGIIFETAPDGSTWTPRAFTPTPPFAGYVAVHLGAGTPVAVSSTPRPAFLDNLNGGVLEAGGRWCPAATLSDDFTSPTQDYAWRTDVSSAVCGLQESGGLLYATVLAGQTGDCAYVSSAAYDLTGSAFTVLVDTPAPSGETTVALAHGTSRLTVHLAGGMFQVDGYAAEAVAPADVAWWRLSESGGALVVETAPDGQTWRTRATVTPPPFDLHEVQLRLGIAVTEGQISDVTTTFDSVNGAP